MEKDKVIRRLRSFFKNRQTVNAEARLLDYAALLHRDRNLKRFLADTGLHMG